MGLLPFPGPVPVIADGRSVAVWAEQGELRVLDDASAEPRSLARPTGCGGYPAADRGRLAFFCSDERGGAVIKVVDAASGDVTATVVAPGLDAYMANRSAHGEAFAVTGVGNALIRLTGNSNKVVFDFYVDRGSRRVIDRLPASPRKIIDLDRPGGRSTLCAPLRARSQATFRSPYLADLRARRPRLPRAVLQRCGRRPIILGPTAAPPLLTTRYVAWASYRRLTVRFLATGRRITYPLAAVDSGYVEPRLTGTERRVFLTYGSGARVVDLGT